MIAGGLHRDRRIQVGELAPCAARPGSEQHPAESYPPLQVRACHDVGHVATADAGTATRARPRGLVLRQPGSLRVRGGSSNRPSQRWFRGSSRRAGEARHIHRSGAHAVTPDGGTAAALYGGLLISRHSTRTTTTIRSRGGGRRTAGDLRRPTRCCCTPRSTPEDCRAASRTCSTRPSAERRSAACPSRGSPPPPMRHRRGVDAHASLAKRLGYVGAVIMGNGCRRLPMTRAAVGAHGVIADIGMRATITEALPAPTTPPGPPATT